MVEARQNKRLGCYVMLLLGLATLLLTIQSYTADAGPLSPVVWTHLGCGNDVFFSPGDRVKINLYVSGYSSKGTAIFELWNHLNDGNWQRFKFGKIALYRKAVIRATLTDNDEGHLLLAAWPSIAAYNRGDQPDSYECRFNVVYYAKLPPLPNVSTHKGCGSEVSFSVGEMMTINYRAESEQGRPHERVFAQLLSEKTSGQLQLLKQTAIWVGEPLTFRKRVRAQDAGRLVLRLWESGSKFNQGVEPETAECIFTVTRPANSQAGFPNHALNAEDLVLPSDLSNGTVDVQIQVFDLKVHLKYSSPWASGRSTVSKLSQVNLPNGTYLVAVRTRKLDGTVKIALQKMIVWR